MVQHFPHRIFKVVFSCKVTVQHISYNNQDKKKTRQKNSGLLHKNKDRANQQKPANTENIWKSEYFKPYRVKSSHFINDTLCAKKSQKS